MEDVLKMKETAEEINIIGDSLHGLDDKSKALIQANINGLITGFRMGLECQEEQDGV
jgi:hypothetical protein